VATLLNPLRLKPNRLFPQQTKPKFSLTNARVESQNKSNFQSSRSPKVIFVVVVVCRHSNASSSSSAASVGCCLLLAAAAAAAAAAAEATTNV